MEEFVKRYEKDLGRIIEILKDQAEINLSLSNSVNYIIAMMEEDVDVEVTYEEE